MTPTMHLSLAPTPIPTTRALPHWDRRTQPWPEL